jgi:hypothetical protein
MGRTASPALLIACLLLGGYWIVTLTYQTVTFYLNDKVFNFPPAGQLAEFNVNALENGVYEFVVYTRASSLEPQMNVSEDVTMQCPIHIKMKSHGQVNEALILSLRRGSFIPSEGVYLYHSDLSWHLRSGLVAVALLPDPSCRDKRLEKAQMALRQIIFNVKERTIFGQLKLLAGLVLIAYGGLGLFELRRMRREAKH